MIYEIRSYRIVPRSLLEVERVFGEAYEYRRKYSELTVFWHTEIGPLNEIVHVWGYRDLAERARIRAEAAKDPHWPPEIREYILSMRSEVSNSKTVLQLEQDLLKELSLAPQPAAILETASQ